MPTNRAVDQFWVDHYVCKETGLCSLCGNSGVIDTRGRAFSSDKVGAGRLNYCVCPNGQISRQIAAREGRPSEPSRPAVEPPPDLGPVSDEFRILPGFRYPFRVVRL